MSVRVRKRQVDYYLLFAIYIFMFTMALARIVDTRREFSAGLPLAVYRLSVYGVLVIDCLYLLLTVARKKKVSLLSISVVLYLVYETAIAIVYRPHTIALIRSLIIDGYTWPLTFLTVYAYFRYEYNGESMRAGYRLVTILGTAVAAVMMIPNIARHLVDYGFLGRTIGPIYYLLAFLPFIYMFCNRRWSVIFAAVITLMVLISTKRGPLLVVVAGIVFFALLSAHNEEKLNNRVNKYIGYIFIGLLVGMIGFYYYNSSGINTVTRILNIIDDQGSGRIMAWKKVLSYFGRSGILKKMIGHGFHSVPTDVMPLNRQIYAHCSYLEVLYDLGICGLFWLIANLIYVFATFRKMIGDRFFLTPALGFSVIYIIQLSAFGYFFEQCISIFPAVILWGMAIGMYKNRHLQLREIA